MFTVIFYILAVSAAVLLLSSMIGPSIDNLKSAWVRRSVLILVIPSVFGVVTLFETMGLIAAITYRGESFKSSLRNVGEAYGDLWSDVVGAWHGRNL